MKELKLPKHIAFIMDGNRRWAKRRGQKPAYGHKKGAERLVEVIMELSKIKEIKYASFFAFSTENWNRDKAEIDAIFELVENMLKENENKFKDANIKIVSMGNVEKFPKNLQDALSRAIEESKDRDELVVNLALSYGGRDDITQAVNKLIASGAKSVTKEDIGKNLYSYPSPDIDFVVRTSGECRLSNFMLFQMAYSELYFPKVCWPAFGKKELLKTLRVYSKRNRRYGGN